MEARTETNRLKVWIRTFVRILRTNISAPAKVCMQWFLKNIFWCGHVPFPVWFAKVEMADQFQTRHRSPVWEWGNQFVRASVSLALHESQRHRWSLLTSALLRLALWQKQVQSLLTPSVSASRDAHVVVQRQHRLPTWLWTGFWRTCACLPSIIGDREFLRLIQFLVADWLLSVRNTVHV